MDEARHATLGQEVAAGAIGGVAGGAAMMAFMTMGKALGFVERPMPVRVEQWAEQQAGVDEMTDESQEMVLGMGEHMLLSAAFGAGYGALRSALDAPPLPSGPLYGMGLFAINLTGVAPALGITQSPVDEPPMATGRRVMMHAVYGAVTALVADRALQAMASR